MTIPLTRGAAASAAFTRLVKSDAPLLFLDLDGTLAPLVERPSLARVPRSTRRTIGALRRTGARIVIVSGRAINGVLRVASLPVDAILGDHGARALVGGRRSSFLDADVSLLDAATARMEALIEATPGIRLERKERSLAIHLRRTAGHSHSTAREVVRRLRTTGLRVLRGRQVIDAQLPGVNKGVAVVRWLARWPSDAVAYAGDDTTDEDAFRALRGRAMLIAVGPRATGATFRSRDPLSLARWLGRLADARGAR